MLPDSTGWPRHLCEASVIISHRERPVKGLRPNFLSILPKKGIVADSLSQPPQLLSSVSSLTEASASRHHLPGRDGAAFHSRRGSLLQTRGQQSADEHPSRGDPHWCRQAPVVGRDSS